MKFVRILSAWLCLAPAALLAAPLVMFTDCRYGRNGMGARRAQAAALAHWSLQPFLWAHRVACCGASRPQQW